MPNLLVALMLISGVAAGYVAGRKGRSRIAWAAIGTALPLLGVLLCIAVPERGAGDDSRQTGAARKPRPRRRPRRCCGSWIPDCQGCDWYHRELFTSSETSDSAGYCEYYGRKLSKTEPSPDEEP
jgi:hypothetical protein